MYGENHRKIANDVRDSELRFKFRFTQIFLEENHWAVLQTRKDSFSRWNSYLMLLDNENEEERGEFKKVVSFPRTSENCETLEKWGCNLCNAVDLTADEEDSSQQFLLNWILKNIPTVAMFCNRDGNVRVNVLAKRIYPSIFLNDNFKYLILERMMEKADKDGIQRFSTIIWQRNENFGCEKLPFNIYFLKRGYFAFDFCYKGIVPFEGSLLKKWKEIIESPSDIEKRIISLIEFADIQQCLQPRSMEKRIPEQRRRMFFRQNESVMGSGAAIAEMVLTHIREDELKYKSNSLEELLKEMDNIGETARWDLYNSMVQFGRYSSLDEETIKTFDEKLNGPLKDTIIRLENEIKEKPSFDMLCSAWIYLALETEQMFEVMNRVKEEYQKYTDVKINPSYWQKKEKIAEYLVGKVPYKFNKEQILQNMHTYEEELLALFHNMECQRVRQKINMLLSSNSYLVSRLNSRRLRGKKYE